MKKINNSIAAFLLIIFGLTIIPQLTTYAQLSGKKILFATKAINDQPLRDKFKLWGATVDTIHAAEFNATTAVQFATYNLIFLSENLGSGDLTILKTLDAPILTTKAYFGNPAAGAWFNGAASNTKSAPSGSIEIINSTGHALTAGFTNGTNVKLVDSSKSTTQWLSVTPNDSKVDCIPIARVPGDSTKFIIVGHEKGSKVYSTSTTTGTPDRILKARIAVVGIHNNAYSYISNDGWTILLAAAQWVIAGGVTDVKYTEQLLTSYALNQNYPNPFNPSTTIRYSISQTSNVDISIYDILGREIIKLVNEEKHPGTYEVKLDGSKLASGIYFYKLRSGSFTQTKKLMLVK